ncbi:hypothetical protein J6590_059250 [Homalodisca vitripennis]|nr:hypothetical protein J6590_059250 [Homalodisca vitripennis]
MTILNTQGRGSGRTKTEVVQPPTVPLRLASAALGYLRYHPPQPTSENFKGSGGRNVRRIAVRSNVVMSLDSDFNLLSNIQEDLAEDTEE